MLSLLFRLSDNTPGSMEDTQHDNDINNIVNEIMMLLSSRPRLGYIENISRINSSILNYGINENFSENTPRSKRALELKQRIETALQRFEPRLCNVQVVYDFESLSNINFNIKGECHSQPIAFTLRWDDAMSHFFCHY